MSGRTTEYRWSRMGYNGQAKDDEVYGKGNLNSALFWQYDTRLGRRWNMDPVLNPWESSYAVFGNSPIVMVDHLGDTYFYNTKGDLIGWDGVNNNTKLMAVNDKTVNNLVKAITGTASGMPVIAYEPNKTQFDLFPVISESEVQAIENIFTTAITKLTEGAMVAGTNRMGTRVFKTDLTNTENAKVSEDRLTALHNSIVDETGANAEYDVHGHPPIFRYLGNDKYSIGDFKGSEADMEHFIGTSGLGVTLGWETSKDGLKLPENLMEQSSKAPGKYFRLPASMIGNKTINFYNNTNNSVGSFKFSDFMKAQQKARENTPKTE